VVDERTGAATGLGIATRRGDTFAVARVTNLPEEATVRYVVAARRVHGVTSVVSQVGESARVRR
jgi:hypothetical protein